MPVCDVCGATLDWGNGYVLATPEVVTHVEYWLLAWSQRWAHVHSDDPEGRSVAALAERQASHRSGWLLCQTCADHFEFDREAARRTAEAHRNPAKRPRADLGTTALAAARAWLRLYGSWPSSVKPTGKIGKFFPHCFSCGKELVDSEMIAVVSCEHAEEMGLTRVLPGLRVSMDTVDDHQMRIAVCTECMTLAEERLGDEGATPE